MLWLQNTKPCAAWCLFCKSLSHSDYCLRKEGGKQLVAVSSISPSFSILCLKRYTQTCTRSAFRGIQCMVISTQAVLNFLKLRTLILCWNVSYLQILYSFYSRFSKTTWAYFSKSFIFYAVWEDLGGQFLKIKSSHGFLQRYLQRIIDWLNYNSQKEVQLSILHSNLLLEK